MSIVSMPLVATLLWISMPVTGRADTIFNTFGPNNSFNQGVTFEEFNGPLQQELLGMGEVFTPTGYNFSLNQISLPLGAQGGTALTLEVTSDDSGQPGNVLESFQIAGIGGGQIFGGSEIFTVNSALHPLLVANQPY